MGYWKQLFELAKEFDKLFYTGEITTMSIIMYTKPNCPYCQQARDHYNSHNIKFVEYDAMYDRERQREMLEFSGGDPTVPAIVENGKFVQSGWGDPPRG